MNIFDSHCHPQFPQYDADREEMLKRNLDKGVFMIAVGANLETSKKAIELANKYGNPPSPDGFSEASMWATVGMHPNASNQELSIKNYADLLKELKVVAVGEIGLDYYRAGQSGKPFDELRTAQLEVFKQFLDLAIQYDKSVVIHSRDAAKGSTGRVHADMLEILNSRSGVRGVAHSFTGTTEEAQKYLDLGFYLGFNGIITFARQYDDMIRSVPLDLILLETDAPYLTPEPYRGQRNEPAFVIEVAKKLAEIKNESLDKIIEQTTENCKHLFKLN